MDDHHDPRDRDRSRSTVQRGFEDELRAAYAFLDSIVENLPDMIFVKDAEDLRFVRFNRAGEELLGLSRSALIGRTDYDFFPREQADFFTRRDRETLAKGTVVDVAAEPIDTPRGRRWLHTKKIPIVDERGRLCLLGISEDITDKKEAEDALRRLNDELERRVEERTAERLRTHEALRRSEEQLRLAQKLEAVGRLAGGIVHDFNNILAVILSYSELLMRRLPGHDADLGQIHAAAQRAAGLTRRLLAFSRQQILEPRAVDLNEIVRALQRMLGPLIGEHIELTLDLGESGWIFADPTQAEQVLLNLALNARDAMPEGGRLRFATRLVEAADERVGLGPGRYVALTVSDTGHGMDESTLARIFEPFFTTKGWGRGTGLGLATVHGIVRQSGGHVSVQSRPGEGTVFEVFLPACPRPESALEAEAAPHPRGIETVLLVEDEAMVRDVARTILESHGYTVLVAADPLRAIEIAGVHEGPIHLLLTDAIMPRMNGHELAVRIASARPDTRVLYMSGYLDDAALRQGVFGRAIHFVEKPFTPTSLARRVREVLDAVEP